MVSQILSMNEIDRLEVLLSGDSVTGDEANEARLLIDAMTAKALVSIAYTLDEISGMFSSSTKAVQDATTELKNLSQKMDKCVEVLEKLPETAIEKAKKVWPGENSNVE